MSFLDRMPFSRKHPQEDMVLKQIYGPSSSVPPLPNEKLLKPFERKFPFDQTCIAIVDELQTQDWEVPGLEIGFDRSQINKTVNLLYLKGPDFRLIFSDRNWFKPKDYYYDHVGIKHINIPERELWLIEDLRFYLYIGENWQHDAYDFMNSTNNPPRTYLLYTGSNNIDRHVIEEGRTPPFLIHADEFGMCDPMPRKGKPPFFSTKEVMEQFNNWLILYVLHPLQEGNVSAFRGNRRSTSKQPQNIRNIF